MLEPRELFLKPGSSGSNRTSTAPINNRVDYFYPTLDSKWRAKLALSVGLAPTYLPADNGLLFYSAARAKVKSEIRMSRAVSQFIRTSNFGLRIY